MEERVALEMYTGRFERASLQSFVYWRIYTVQAGPFIYQPRRGFTWTAYGPAHVSMQYPMGRRWSTKNPAFFCLCWVLRLLLLLAVQDWKRRILLLNRWRADVRACSASTSKFYSAYLLARAPCGFYYLLAWAWTEEEGLTSWNWNSESDS